MNLLQKWSPSQKHTFFFNNFYPLKPLFYTVKLGFTESIHYFFFLFQKYEKYHFCFVLFFFFCLKIFFFFFVVNFSEYLNRRVFVMFPFRVDPFSDGT